eukprot:CAMPEP_0170404978 /NCGR_PEP_ID=MMETSP0117_2-20130122/26929_1 /TAXON_ID=400756 /ORGANISM="Durinskia baltica, Strain CSIRO CS-38" /LENGTH=494 /DNA_ID=CAMNT_0010662049 /DNA_START=145 /DNA_END=1629 /DNA_ORIENTATION=+
MASKFTRIASMSARNSRFNLLSKAYFSSFPDHLVVAMPALSPTMETGAISKWNVKVGDKFEVGTSLCEVETDKATVSFDATDEGYIAKILVSTGDIKVGQPIMVTVEESDAVSAFANYTHTGDAAPAPVAAPTPAAAAAPTPVAQAAPARTSTPSSSSSDRVFASPLAKKMARESGTTIEAIADQLAAASSAGSGPNGRIIAADVMRASTMPRANAGVAAAASASTATATASVSPQPAAIASTAPSSSVGGVYTDFQLSDLAQTLAARQTHAKQVVPHYYLSVDLNLSELLKVRGAFNAQAASMKKKGVELSVQDFMVKAAALAMQQVPDVNGSWMDTFVRRYDQVDINLVMGAGSFVATPVLRDVTARGLSSIATEIASFEDTLFSESGASALTENSEKMAVGTFSIHNLGMYGVKSAAPIVLTPQACALSLGAIVQTVIPASGAAAGEQDWAVAPIVTATLSCDHRVVDGAVGAQWLAAFKNLVENPVSMLL